MLTHPKQGKSKEQQVPQGGQKTGAGSQEGLPQNPTIKPGDATSGTGRGYAARTVRER